MQMEIWIAFWAVYRVLFNSVRLLFNGIEAGIVQILTALK